MKKILLIVTFIFTALTITACNKNNDAIIFKNDYESLNGTTNSNGKAHREVTIPEKNPIVITDAKTIVSKIENGDTFYVYFGSKLCPWCRSVIEKALEVANENDIEKIYYVDIWDDEGNEILRDKYSIDSEGTATLIDEGTEEYHKLLEYMNDVLSEYKGVPNEKRIYAPNFIYISKGKATRLTSGISELQTDSREELTEEMLKDEQKQFDEFFINVCDESC